MALRMTGAPRMPMGNLRREDNAIAASTLVIVPRSRLQKLLHQLPPWSHLPLACCAVLLVLLVAMLPVYYKFKDTNAQQEEATVWPAGKTIVELLELDQVTVELDLVDVRPAQREIEWLVELSFGGVYGAEAESGVFDIGENLDMVVRLGKHQSLKLTQGDNLGDTSVIMIVDDVSPLMNYPYDKYKTEFEVTALIVNTSVEPYEETLIAAGLVLYEGELGWETHTQISALYEADGVTVRHGYIFSMDVARSTSVKFFSMFIVILMWAISLFVFVLALNYCLTNTSEISYDVPALAVGLLFALPFVRDVQPNVPVVGATIDVFGFFWNIALVAGAAIIVLAALASRVQRNTVRQYEEAEAVLVAKQQELELLGNNTPTNAVPGIVQVSLPSVGAVVAGKGGWAGNRDVA